MLRAGFFTALPVGALAGIAEDVFEPPAIPTPAITKTSSSGDVLSFSIDGAGYLIGYYIRLQLAGNSGFTTDYPGESDIRDDYRILTIEDFTDGDVNGTVEMDALSGLQAQNAGLAYLRICYGQEADDGLSIEWGPWSNTISDTVVLLSPTKFATTNGANKHADSTVSNSDLRVSSIDNNATNCVRCLQQPAADETQFEFTIVSVVGEDHGVYVEDGTTVLGPTTPNAPTVGNSAIRMGMHNTYDNNVQGGNSGADAFFGNPDPGDVWSIVIKKSTKTIKVYHTPISTGVTTLRATKTVTGSNFYVACMARSTGGIFDFNFGESAFLRPLDSGVVAWNG